MYCKHCGKQISDDSAFCQYCGGKVDIMAKEPIKGNETAKEFSENDESLIREIGQDKDIVIANKESRSLQVEVSQKPMVNSSTIANEIVGNLKMIGIAFAMFAVYMLGFMIYHQNDIKEYDYLTSSYLGESCYDHSLSGNWKLDWREHYYESLYYDLNREVPIFCLTPERCMEEAKYLEKKLDYSENLLENLKNEAKNRANRDIQDWNDTINSNRKYRYEEDMKKNATYASTICLILCVFGRYIVKLTKWVYKNKTK